jgi:hypothetical protein
VEGRWAPLPPLGPSESLPLFYQVAAVDGRRGSKQLVVVVGWHQKTLTDAVLTGTWRRSAPMPGPRRPCAVGRRR